MPCFLFIFVAGVKSGPLLQLLIIGLLYQTRMLGDDDCGASSGLSDRENRNTEEIYLRAALCITDPV
jgi:hypothetical protein